MKILINNLQRLVQLPIKELKILINIILKNLGEEKAVIGITFVDDKTIHALNKKFRKKDKPTDVLSFYFKKDLMTHNVPLPHLLGDVVISIETAINQAKYYKHSLEKELKILLVHGILHLLDYDHIKKKDKVLMNKKERELLEVVNRL